ncbi:MAG TPA: hypothetical protein VHD15_18570 [Hyphomicrobiales bacterium]|nr:hypothetical protein [Hyphomicrobiales bacterium]
MRTITIKDLDQSSFEALSELARQNRNSIESEAVLLLQQALEVRAKRAELVRIADEIAAMTPKGVKQTDSVELLHEDRAR